MNSLCNLKNVVYQDIIFPKKNTKKNDNGISSSRWK